MAITPKPRGNVLNYYRDNKTRTFNKTNTDNKWTSLSIANDGSNSITLTINDMDIIILSGEIFDDDFEDFTSVTITATNNYYRLYLRG